MQMRDSTPEERARSSALRHEQMLRLNAPVASLYDADGYLLPQAEAEKKVEFDPEAAPPGVHGWTRQHAYNDSLAAALTTGGFDDEADLNGYVNDASRPKLIWDPEAEPEPAAAPGEAPPKKGAFVPNPDWRDTPDHRAALAIFRWKRDVLDPWVAESDEPAESGPTYNPAPQEG